MSTSASVPGRRQFFCTASGALLALALPGAARSRVEPMTFGLCADVHQDIMHDAEARLEGFINEMNARRVAFIVQLGDFCIPKPANRPLVDLFDTFAGPRYHVLGNHDTDGDDLSKNGYTWDETKAFWGMETNYYAFVRGGVRFIVLDGNDRPDGADTSYPRHVGGPQMRWLERELARTREPVVVLSHQSPENAEGIDNGADVRALLEDANRAAGWRRVLACFTGHHHLNDLVEVREIPYVQINSMSYFWVGEECRNQAYSDQIHAARPMLAFTAPYRDPLWTTVTIDPIAGEIRVEGRESAWAGQAPEELGYAAPLAQRKGMSPRIDPRRLEIDRRGVPRLA